jgi:hypothetical protein
MPTHVVRYAERFPATPRTRPVDAIATTQRRDRIDAGHDFALGQMPVAHQPLISELVGMAAEQGGYFALDSLRQQRSCTIAQQLGQRIGGRAKFQVLISNISKGPL